MIPIAPTYRPYARHGGMLRALAVTTGLLLCWLVLGVGRAHASTYQVENCVNGQTVWTPFNNLGSIAAGQTCSSGTTDDFGSVSGSSSTRGPSFGWYINAPSGTTFDALSYTGGQFTAKGGWGSGWFGAKPGGGLDAVDDPTDVVNTFNNTPHYDCLAVNQDTYDANSGSSGPYNCNASTAGYPYGSGIFTGLNLTEIALGVECRTAGSSCSSTGAGASANSIKVEVNDPYGAPSITRTDSTTFPGGWTTGAYLNQVGATYQVDAHDPAGVCGLTAQIYNAAGQPVASASNGVTPAYDGSTGAFTSAAPCGGADMGTAVSTNWANLTSGAYYLNAAAQNPANWRNGGNGWQQGAGPTDGTTVLVDNSTPSVAYSSGPSQSSWLAGSQGVQVNTSDTDGMGTGSGVNHVHCENQQTGAHTDLTVDNNGDPVDLPASMWPDGTSTVDCTAYSNVGTGSATQSYTEHVDTQVPSTAFDGAGTGAADVPQVLDAAPGANPNDQQDPALTVNASEGRGYDESGVANNTCTVNGNNPVTVPVGATIPASQFSDGVNTVSCYSTTNAGVDNSAHPSTETVDVEQTAPQVTLGGATPYDPADPSTYANGPVQVTLRAAEPAGTYPNSTTFGVQSVQCAINGASPEIVDGNAGTFNITGTGMNSVSCQATNDAGVTSAPVTETIAIDTSAPSSGGGTVSSGPTSPGGYTQGSQSITVSFSAAGGAQMKEIRCTLQGVTTDYYPGDAGVTMSNNNDTESLTLTIDPPGGTLTCQGEDTAGNWSAPESWNFNIDDTPPTGVFEPQQPSNPALIQALLADGGSGVATAQIQINEGGTWQNLTTTYNPSTGIASASIPDNGAIPDGTYPLQVIATDNAGNSTATAGSNITTNSSGQPETITLPLRIVTQLSAVLAAGSTQVNAVASTPMFRRGSMDLFMSADAKKKGPAKKKVKAAPKGCTYKRVVTRKANKKKHVKAASKLVKVCAKTPTVGKATTGALTLAYGEKSTVTGELQTQQNVPIPNAEVVIEQTVAATPTATVAKNAAVDATTAQATVVGKTTTNAKGQFTYTIPAGPSRTLTFLYQGTPVLRTSSASQNEEVDGQSTIKMPSSVVHGKKVTISGQLSGGNLPPGGALVQLWYTTKGGLVQWAPFAQAVHTNGNGGWSLTFPVAKKAKGITYEFKAVVSTQAGWAYLGTTTAVLTRKIR